MKTLFQGLLVGVVLTVVLSCFFVQAQTHSPGPSAAPSAAAVISAPAAASANFIEAHGGLYATVILVVWSANTLLAAFQSIVEKWGATATGLNKIASLVSKALDFLMGNPKH